MDSDKKQAFMNLYEPVHDRLAKYAMALTADEENAKDLVSDVLLIAFENLEKIRQPEKFIFYLFGIASRLFKKQLRRNKFKANFDETSFLKDQGQSPSEYAGIQMLYYYINKLPQKQAEAIVLYEISGFKLKEISRIQSCTLSAAKSRITRARQKLMSWFENENPYKKNIHTQFIKEDIKKNDHEK